MTKSLRSRIGIAVLLSTALGVSTAALAQTGPLINAQTCHVSPPAWCTTSAGSSRSVVTRQNRFAAV
ncbi:MAG: hypothetical protein IH987_03965 [Planctomycetes bacterium]|nr:hypothetical protein [Planctomycetota bacterium]